MTLWLGAVDIPLEGEHLPARTRVDVSVGIDRDGCIDAEAIIQDGSGRRQRVFIDPRIGSPQPKVDEPEEVDDTPKDVWRAHLMWSMSWAEIAMKDYEWLFSDHRATATLQRLVRDAQVALDQKNETQGRRIEKEIDDTLERELKAFMLLLWGEMRCLNSALEPGKRNQIRACIKGIVDGLHSNQSVPEISAKMDQLVKLLNETKNVGQTPGTTDKGTLLTRG